MKIIFMGTPKFAANILKNLIDNNYEIVLIVTKPDAAKTKKGEYIFSPVKKIALENNIKLIQPLKIKDVVDEILNYKASLIITAAYGQILPKSLIDNIKAINVHGSILPKYRGGAPIQYALFNGDKKTGVTIMNMAYKMDSGDILLQEELEILENDNYETLSNKMSFLGAKLLNKVLSKNYLPIKQDESKVTFAYTLKREDEFLNFYGEKFDVINHLKGLGSSLGASIVINNEIYKIYNMKKNDIIKIENDGEIVIKKNQLFIKSKSYVVEVLEIQAPGKKKMSVKDFLNGQKKIKTGDFVEKRWKYMKKNPTLFSREKMLKMNIEILKERGVSVAEIAEIAHHQQSRYTKDIPIPLCVESVEKILSYRDVFHFVHLAAEIDRLVEEKAFKSPLQDILHDDLGLFGVDETIGLDLAGLYGTIGQTNFGDIDVNKVGVIARINEEGKKDGVCHTFLDDVVGAIAAAASTRVAQIINEEFASTDNSFKRISIFDFENKQEDN